MAKKKITGMKDTGKRRKFKTGAMRDRVEGKPRPVLISPFLTERLAKWLEMGARKYTGRNWELGIPIEEHFDSLERHLIKCKMRIEDEDHEIAVICNMMFILHTREMIRRGLLPKSLDNMPYYEKRKK